NRIKAQARDNDNFRRTCIRFAQSIHRVDMRLRLGLLQDAAAIERQAAREAKEAAARKAKAETPTVKTEAQQRADDAAAAKDKEKEVDGKAKKAHHQQPRIRPLSEAKAIETGANFISETFIFGVALGMLVLERWYSRTKENNRRSDVAERMEVLEARDAELARRVEEMGRELEEWRAGKGNGTGKGRGGSWFWDKSGGRRVQGSARDENRKKEDEEGGESTSEAPVATKDSLREATASRPPSLPSPKEL
ncbi:MAG: hypothetical protein LQ340_003602, partial [Diploschistes diacapsis]